MASEARFAVVSRTGSFDFSPAFEDAVLRIVPSALFLVVALQRLFWLARQPRKVAKSHRPFVKVALLLYCALNAHKWPFSQLRTSAAVLAFVDGFLLLFLSHVEHARSVRPSTIDHRPSTIINVYLLFTLLLDCTVAEILWLANHDYTISSLFTATIVIKLVNLSPETTSGILARSVFWWLNSLMRTGFARSLTGPDMLPIHDSLAARTLLPEARDSVGSSNPSNRHALALSTLWATKYIFLAGVAPRLSLAAFKYTLPFVIARTTSWTADPSQPDEIGWGLTGAWLLVFLGQAISNGFHYQMTYRVVTAVRGSLCSLIYTTTLNVSSTTLDESVAVLLMSTYTESICQSASSLHELWAAPIESAVAIFLLYRQLGLTALAPAAVAIVATPGTLQLARFIGPAKKRWMRGIQTRVDVTASVLASMKMTQGLRITELDLSKQYRRLSTVQTFIAMNTATIAPLATFATFVIVSKSTGQPLNTESAYTSLSLIYFLSDPLSAVPYHPIRKPSILNDITLNIRKSCFTFVVGPVGSGKSTLIRAILGEVPLRSGSIHADLGNIAFVGQEPWIQNLKIRQNILGSASYDSKWYKTAVHACGLEQDIAHFPKGDATKAGSAGFSLSGGQKQRLALARAVYSRETTVILDDVFAGQDAATEEHVFHRPLSADGNHRDYLHGLAVEQNGDSNAAKTSSLMQQRPETTSDGAGSPGRVLGELATYTYYFGSVPVWHTILLAALVILYAAGYRMTGLVLSFWTQTAEESEQATNNYYLGLFPMLTGFAVVGITGTAYFFLVVMVPLSSGVLHVRLLQAVMDAPLPFFSRTDVGVLTNRFSQDMSVIDMELAFALVDFCINLCLIIMSIILITANSAAKFYLRTSQQVRLLDLEAKSPLFTQFLDLLQGLSTVRAFAWGPRFIERYLDLLDASQRPFYLLFCIQRWLALVLGLLIVILVTVMLVLVVQLREQLSPQFVALAFVQVMSFCQSLARVIQDWTKLETSLGTVARVKTFCTDTESENRPTETGTVPENWPTHGHVVIADLVAAYDSRDSEPVLRGVTLDVPAGTKIGICGRSGSGKSSLLGCILRLLELGPGSRITIDGNPFFLKHTNLRDNLVVLHRPQEHEHHEQRPEHSETRILQVLRQLKLDDLVGRLGGLDSPLDADRLSQGQRQLLCIARAMLAGKQIILIDEASSNVDERSERLIKEVMREQFADCTVIAVAHRLGAVVDFDRVAVMGGGRVLEWDNPRALLERDSEFRRLWDLGAS
ncbi:P-loop containing nucleoside triphosphate hydrolase protein [Aspergillus germanicus]